MDVIPIILAAEFHYRFIRIHPFDDGNGRVARILMNFILMQLGYPPVIITTEDKENYYRVLRLADADQIEPFIEYIAQNLIRSLEIMIRGAKGESVEESEDLDKELSLLEQKIKNVAADYEIVKNAEVISNLYKLGIEPLLEKLVDYGKKFSRYYTNFTYQLDIKPDEYQNFQFHDISEKFNENLGGASFSLNYTKFLQLGFGGFNYRFQVNFSFDQLTYIVFVMTVNHRLQKLYKDNISDEEIKQIVEIFVANHMDMINHRVEEFEKNKIKSQS